MVNVCYFLVRSMQATLVVFLLSLSIGCNSSHEGAMINDTVSEFACCVSTDRMQVLVAANRVLNKFEFEKTENNIAILTATLKTPWTGRVISLSQVGKSDLYLAIVFDANARRSMQRSDHIYGLDRVSMYTFQIIQRELANIRLIKNGFFDLRLLDESTLLFTVPSDVEFNRDCDVSRKAIVASYRMNDDGTEIEILEPDDTSRVFCSATSAIRYGSREALPFLTDSRGIVTGRWDNEVDFRFVPTTLERPSEPTDRLDVSQLFDYSYSIDVSNNKNYIATAVSLTSNIRYSVWNFESGKLEFDTIYPKGEPSGVFNPVRCIAVGKTQFCLGWGSNIRIIEWNGKLIHELDTQELTKEYHSALVLAAELLTESVEVSVALTPFDAKSVRKIRIPIQ